MVAGHALEEAAEALARPEPAADLAHHLLAKPVVAHEGHAAVLAHVVGGGLADVVQERAEAKRLPAGELVRERLVQHLAQLAARLALELDQPLEHLERVPVDVEVVVVALLHVVKVGELGKDRAHEAEPVREREPVSAPGATSRRRSSANTRSPDASPTRGAASAVRRSVSGSGVKPSSAAKRARRSGRSGSFSYAARPEHAERAGLEVGLPAEWVDQLASLRRRRRAAEERPRHRVHREVALGEVLLDRLPLEPGEVVDAAAAPVDDPPGAEGLGELEHRPAQLGRQLARRPLGVAARRRCRCP